MTNLGLILLLILLALLFGGGWFYLAPPFHPFGGGTRPFAGDPNHRSAGARVAAGRRKSGAAG